MLEKGALHFHDFGYICKTYPLQSNKKRGIPVEEKKADIQNLTFI